MYTSPLFENSTIAVFWLISFELLLGQFPLIVNLNLNFTEFFCQFGALSAYTVKGVHQLMGWF